MEKLNQNNAIIKRVDKGQLHWYIKNKHSEKIIMSQDPINFLNTNTYIHKETTKMEIYKYEPIPPTLRGIIKIKKPNSPIRPAVDWQKPQDTN